MRISDWSSDVCSSDLHALRRIGEFPAFAATALFGGAGLFIDDDGDALHIAQLALQRIEFVAVVDGPAFAEAAVCIVERSEERRGGKECASTSRSRWAPYN